MNEQERQMVQRYKDSYPPGTRIELQRMGNDPRPIESGTRGTVKFVDDMGTVHCQFDNGRCLGLIPGEDVFYKITNEEKQREKVMDEEVMEELAQRM